MQEDRAFGVLLHPVSFNSPYGIGDLGAEARLALKSFADAGVKLWQILPLGPTGYGNSPYSALSTFAGNELLIDLRLIPGVDIGEYPDGALDRNARVDYGEVYKIKVPFLKKTALDWYRIHSQDHDFLKFCAESEWLDDYALFRAISDREKDTRWYLWPEGLKNRDASELKAAQRDLSTDIGMYKTLQYFFYRQWNSLHEYANGLGIKIIGDIPFFVSPDSVDAWTGRDLFRMDADGLQTESAGVPPDAFSPTGQFWGNPVYNWEYHKKTDYSWWRRRLEHTLSLVDIVRVDHFRGFEACWHIPSGDKTAENGRWVKGPGMDLLKYFKGKPIIAEDLGVITDEVVSLMEQCGFPGMKILQFAFDRRGDGLDTANWYLPFNYKRNCVAYTGTHDNQTSSGWFSWQDDGNRDLIRRFFQCSDNDVVWQMIRSLASSVARYVVVPVQDIMGLDDNYRMNIPNTVGGGNWSYRYNPDMMQPWMLDRLSDFIKLYGR